MPRSTRRDILAAALSLAATPAFAGRPRGSTIAWREDRARYPQGVASGDPRPDSVILWTRREPRAGETAPRLTLEVAEDKGFGHVVATAPVSLGERADWTCRVLVGGLKPARTYWYRFTDADGAGSRIGRTRTAPRAGDRAPARFAFVSCQNANLGPLTAWRRMIFDDQRAPEAEQLGFVLHLGDFVYETCWYPADRPQGYFDRKPRQVLTYPDGEKHDDFHVPTSLADYRTLYRAYLADQDLQDARARWPFVAIWDNGEYSDKGWQGLQYFEGVSRPAQTRKVAANQAWFEYIPARVRTADGSLEAFAAPTVQDRPVERFDAAGLGIEPDNLAAIRSLIGYRTQAWGAHIELILTDQRSYRSVDYTFAPGAKGVSGARFPQMIPYETLKVIDAGRAWNGGAPPDRLQYADSEVANFHKDATARTLLGEEQKAWLLERLAASKATWKIWGDTVASFDMRADPQNLPTGLTAPWPGKDYAGYPRTDHSTAFVERRAVLDFVAERGIDGLAIVSGDRHSFWAGYAAADLPPAAFKPVGVNFVVGSISSPGMVEALEYTLAKQHPLRALYLADRPGRAKPEATVNLLLKHGVRSALDYAAHGDLPRAKALSNPGNAPHVEFVDMGGHGYAAVRASAERLDVEFVCVPRPVEANAAPDGGPIRYRVTHSARRWTAGQAPKLVRTRLEGDAELSG